MSANKERAICMRLVSRALAAGYSVSVFDGEEFLLVDSRNKTAILAAMFSTDYDALTFRDATGRKIGVVALIYGNGEDVISDYSDNEATCKLVESVNV